MQVVRAARAIPLLLAAIVLLLGFAACGGDDDDDEGGEAAATETQAGGGEADGAAVFVSAGCGGCHTLAAANSSGQTGPNLDDVMPSQDAVAEQVRNGGGAMPAFEGELTDAEIDAVAQYVADSAGG
jgi:mono/diheme cytochrome c family protein